MKVIFLDFDGVLNSSASFLMEKRKTRTERGNKPVHETLCRVCCSNFQYILDKVPDTKIVISSAWRHMFHLDALKDILKEYGVDSTNVIDITPTLSGEKHWQNASRGAEINAWLANNPQVVSFAVIDDNHIGDGLEAYGVVVKTDTSTGLQLRDALKAIKLLGGKSDGSDLPS